jgi:hypothetical protein
MEGEDFPVEHIFARKHQFGVQPLGCLVWCPAFRLSEE